MAFRSRPIPGLAQESIRGWRERVRTGPEFLWPVPARHAKYHHSKAGGTGMAFPGNQGIRTKSRLPDISPSLNEKLP